MGELAEQLARDLDGAFEALVVEHQDRIYALALRMTGDHHEAEDAAQDAFVRAYRALAEYPPGRIRALDVRPWLTTIALNALRNRRRTKRPALVSLDGTAPAEAPDAIEESVQRSAVDAHVARLPVRMRAAVVLRYVEDYDYDQIAVALNVPPGTAKSDVHRGLQRLRDMLAEEESR
jgi:RNA polymerase sigma-70 factor (ECF subfamily)